MENILLDGQHGFGKLEPARCKLTYGMVNKFVVKGLNPRPLRVRVMYRAGGVDGMNSINPMA